MQELYWICLACSLAMTAWCVSVTVLWRNLRRRHERCRRALKQVIHQRNQMIWDEMLAEMDPGSRVLLKSGSDQLAPLPFARASAAPLSRIEIAALASDAADRMTDYHGYLPGFDTMPPLSLTKRMASAVHSVI